MLLEQCFRPARDVTVYLIDLADQIEIIACHLTIMTKDVPLHHLDISLQLTQEQRYPEFRQESLSLAASAVPLYIKKVQKLLLGIIEIASGVENGS